MILGTNKWIKTCYTCGILAPNHCSKCKIVNYCCRAHQIYDWKHGHREICDGNQKIIRINKFLFPEYEIVMEREDKEDAHNSNDLIKEEEEIKKYETMVQKNEAGIFQNEDIQNELMNMANQQEDETFSKFLSTIKKYPDQILRFSYYLLFIFLALYFLIITLFICNKFYLFIGMIEEAIFYIFQDLVKLMKYQNVQNVMEKDNLNFR